MPAQFELFQQLLSSDTDDYSVAHAATVSNKGKRRNKAEHKMDPDADTGTFIVSTAALRLVMIVAMGIYSPSHVLQLSFWTNCSGNCYYSQTVVVMQHHHPRRRDQGKAARPRSSK